MLNSLGAQLDIFARARHFAADAVERELAHLQAFRRRLPAAQQHADPGQQLDERERLYQIIVGPAFQALHAVVHLVARAQNQHWRAGFSIANLLQHREPVHVRQTEIENDQIVLGGVDHIDRMAAVARDVHGITAAFKAPRQKIGDPFFVLHDEDTHIY